MNFVEFKSTNINTLTAYIWQHPYNFTNNINIVHHLFILINQIIYVFLSSKTIVPLDDRIDIWLNDSVSIYNAALYILRQAYFDAKNKHIKPVFPTKKELYTAISRSDVWKNSTMDAPSKRNAAMRAYDDMSNFYKAVKRYNKSKSGFNGKPKFPNYKDHDKDGLLEFYSSRLTKKDEKNHRFALPKYLTYIVKVFDKIDISKIKEVLINRYYGKLAIYVIYEVQPVDLNLNKTKCIGIDLGIDNLAAISGNEHVCKSWLIKGGAIKSINQYYNKKMAKLQSCAGTKVTKRMLRLLAKRDCKIDYEFNCISSKIIQLCTENDIGTIVIGHNEGWKQNVNLGKKNNQKFVQIPFNKLIQKIQYKAELVGIDVILVNESYTSKCDHLVGESMTHHDQYAGKRIKRGLFKSSVGKLINADINGAIGILRKANVVSDAGLAGLRNRGDIVSPVVVKL